MVRYFIYQNARSGQNFVMQILQVFVLHSFSQNGGSGGVYKKSMGAILRLVVSSIIRGEVLDYAKIVKDWKPFKMLFMTKLDCTAGFRSWFHSIPNLEKKSSIKDVSAYKWSSLRFLFSQCVYA